MRTVVYDVETFQNFFSYIDVDVDTGEMNEFVICKTRNDYKEFVEYCHEMKYRVGFNNIYFDAPVIHMLTENYDRWHKYKPEKITLSLWNMVQAMIQSNERMRVDVAYEIDLFLINHYNNKARSTSLKALQCSIFWENVQDMPLAFDEPVPEEKFQEVLDYNKNDVLSTQAFYNLCLDKISFRQEMSKQYKKNMTNMPDITIGEEIFLRYIRRNSGLSRKQLKDKVTFDPEVHLEKIVFDYVGFESLHFKKLLSDVCSTVVSEKNKLKNVVHYKGMDYYFGVGGIHACITPGVYTSDDKYVILDFDVKSYYPNLAIQNGLHPKHIPQDVFVNTYRQLFEERVAAQKAKDKVKDAGIKLSLNGIFGKTGESTSAFYDRYYFYAITLNGQLTLAMLAEKYVNHIQGIQILQVNTDGITVRVPREKLVKLSQINSRFVDTTKLILEDKEYQKMVIFNVNNYLAVDKNGDVKKKGLFETKKELHKDNSFLVVAKALENYFVYDKPVEETIYENENIYDFCGRYKASKGWHAEYNYSKDGQVISENHGKVLRFYPIEEGGGNSFKINVDGRIHHLLANQKTMIFNRYFPVEKFSDYKINYNYFIHECRKIISQIEPKQLQLF